MMFGLKIVLILLLTFFETTFGEKCPEGTYVKAIDVSVDKTKRVVTAVSLSCVRLEEQVESAKFEVAKYLTSSKGSSGKSTGLEFCYRGLAWGIKKRYVSNPPSLSDVVLMYANGTGTEYLTKSKGVDSGNWQQQGCQQKYALCGLTTDVTSIGGVTALKDILEVCCPLPEPAESCKPTDDWMTVLDTDNRKATDTLKYSYTWKMGIQIVGVTSDSVLDEIAAQIGFRVDDNVVRHLGLKFETSPSARGNTKHVWSRADTAIFNTKGLVDSPASLELTVPAEYDVNLQQAVGKCGPYVVRTNAIKRVDSGGYLPSSTFTISQLIAFVLVLSSIF